MRNAFIEELCRLTQDDPTVFLVVGDLGFSVIEPYAERFPDNFFNAGIAEQSMMGMAAGMASEGCHVFVYSIANFPTFRCAEQIRNDVDYHNLAVTVVSVGGGLAYGNMGYSHHAVQDYGLMRLMPNMLIAAPGDPMEVRACMRYLAQARRPSYLRLGKAGEPSHHPSLPAVEPGRWLRVAGPARARKTLLTTGATLDLARQWLDLPAYADYALHSLPLWGMSCKDGQPDQIAAWDEVLMVEDHLEDGGFSSWMRDATWRDERRLLTRLNAKALSPMVCGTVGKQATLNAFGGLVP